MDNFYNTAKRMWKDANVLNNNTPSSSWFNTCYLAGYILECYGKLIITAFSRTSVNPRELRHRLDTINDKIQSEIIVNPAYSKYCLDLKTQCNTIYEGQHKWTPNNRYEDNPNLWNTPNIANDFIKESEIVVNMINTMKLDGVI